MKIIIAAWEFILFRFFHKALFFVLKFTSLLFL